MDPVRGPDGWAWQKAEVDLAWGVARGSAGIIVATIDTGVDSQHPDLAGALLPGATFLSSPAASCTPGDEDDNAHGTHIAGIIGATGADPAGVRGVAFGVRILPIKALDCTGGGATSDIARAIVWATDHGARIVNISLGTPFDSSSLRDAVRYALAHDVLLVAAAGNCGIQNGHCAAANAPEYPAAYAGVVAVGATDADDGVLAFSTRGAQLTLTAPGAQLRSTAPSYPTYLSARGTLAGYAMLSGTSQASAFVSGVAALVWSARPALSAADVFTVLTSTADDLGARGRDDAYGFGRVNALRAVQRALSDAPSEVVAIP